MTDDLTVVLAVAAFAPLYIDLFLRLRSSRGIELEVEKFYEAGSSPVATLWSVRILHPSKAIEHCKVFLGDTPLPFWDSPPNHPHYERKIPASGGANVRVPETIRDEQAFITVKNGKKTLRRARLSEIPRGA